MAILKGKAGETIYDAIDRAISYCKSRNVEEASLIFNDVHLKVSEQSMCSDIAEIYFLKIAIIHLAKDK